MQEMWVRSLGWEDPLENEMATYSSNRGLFLFFFLSCYRYLEQTVSLIIEWFHRQHSIQQHLKSSDNYSFTISKVAIIFPLVMYGCESWTVKKAEHWRTDTFELWCWRRLLKEPACQCRRYKRCEYNPWIWTIPWRRTWQHIPVFLPGESHGQRSLAGYSLSGRRVGHDWVTNTATIKWQELVWGYILHDPNYMTFWKRQSCGDGRKIHDCQRLVEMGRRTGKAEDT